MTHGLLAQASKSYEVMVGNHDYLHLTVNDNEATFRASYMNNTQERIQLLRKSKILVLQGSSGSRQVPQNSPEFAHFALKLRDFVSMFSASLQFRKDEVVEEGVHPELNILIDQIGQMTHLQPSALANCILYPTHSKENPWLVAGGAHGLLGRYQNNISRVWVRTGYELVLLAHSMFKDLSLHIIAKGDGNSTGQGLAILETLAPAGTHFGLAQSEMDKQVGSFLCRPDISR
jgi:hypothetical protein